MILCRGMKKILMFFCLVFFSLSGCVPREKYLRDLGENGNVNVDAPIVSTVTITIDAPAAKVWGIITDIPNWASWNSKVKSTHANGITYLGDNFAWRSKLKTYSAVLIFNPEKKILWLSDTMSYKSITKWDFEKISPNQTKVTLSESRDGFLMRLSSAKDHQKYLNGWLMSLKIKAETVVF